MRAAARIRERLFRLVCLGTSALLLVLVLFWQISLAHTQARITALENAITAARAENARLMLESERAADLEALEQAALQELGLQRPAPGQIISLEGPG